MTIEGLGKKFQEARLARGLTLDEAARMTKIRPSRLAEIEADDFSQFPSLAYAKGFLLIYGKFLDVDVTPYMEAFETSPAVTVDGYSYLQEESAPAPTRTPIVRRRVPRVSAPSSPSGSGRPSLMPLIIGLGVIIIGFFGMKLVVNVLRLAPRTPQAKPAAQSSPAAPIATATPASIIAPPTQATAKTNIATPAPTTPTIPAAPAPTAAATAPPVAAAVSPLPSPPPAKPAASEPEVRRAKPVRPEDLANAAAAADSSPAQSTGSNRVTIKPLKKPTSKSP